MHYTYGLVLGAAAPRISFRPASFFAPPSASAPAATGDITSTDPSSSPLVCIIDTEHAKGALFGFYVFSTSAHIPSQLMLITSVCGMQR